MTMRRPSTPSSSPGCHRWTIRERLSPGWCLAGACRAGSRGDFRTLFPPLEQIFHARRRPVPHSGIGGLVASASQRVHVDLGQFVGRRLNGCPDVEPHAAVSQFDRHRRPLRSWMLCAGPRAW